MGARFQFRSCCSKGARARHPRGAGSRAVRPVRLLVLLEMSCAVHDVVCTLRYMPIGHEWGDAAGGVHSGHLSARSSRGGSRRAVSPKSAWGVGVGSTFRRPSSRSASRRPHSARARPASRWSKADREKTGGPSGLMPPSRLSTNTPGPNAYGVREATSVFRNRSAQEYVAGFSFGPRAHEHAVVSRAIRNSASSVRSPTRSPSAPSKHPWDDASASSFSSGPDSPRASTSPDASARHGKGRTSPHRAHQSPAGPVHGWGAVHRDDESAPERGSSLRRNTSPERGGSSRGVTWNDGGSANKQRVAPRREPARPRSAAADRRQRQRGVAAAPAPTSSSKGRPSVGPRRPTSAPFRRRAQRPNVHVRGRQFVESSRSPYMGTAAPDER